jgi:hypothetical protein
MILKSVPDFFCHRKLRRSTVSSLGENKRGEFLHAIPPPKPRQRRKYAELPLVLNLNPLSYRLLDPFLYLRLILRFNLYVLLNIKISVLNTNYSRYECIICQ